jgi:hypothetical protein
VPAMLIVMALAWVYVHLRLSRLMVYCASHHRRHHSWHMYSSPTCRTARRSSWI